MEEQGKILERIRRLLAMAKDTGSPNEAAIAARRARKLMDDYQVTELDLTSTSASDMGEHSASTDRKTAGTFEGVLAAAVSKLNDCNVVYARNRHTGHLDLRFKGFLADAVTATEIFCYVRDEGFSQSKKNASGRSNRHAYRLGFASGIAAQVRDILEERANIKTSAGTSLVLCKKALVTEHFGRSHYSHTKVSHSGDRSAYVNGVRQGLNTSLNTQVGESNTKRITG